MIELKFNISRQKTGRVLIESSLIESGFRWGMRTARSSWLSNNCTTEKECVFSCVFSVPALLCAAFGKPGRMKKPAQRRKA